MKGTASVNPLFETLEIKNPTIYRVQPIIAADNHRLYFGSVNTSIKWEHKSIINCSYTKRYGAILILCEDGKLYIYNQSLNEIAKIPWESKYSVGLELIQKLNMFLMIGATQVQIQYVRINSNIKTTKFVSSMVFGVEKRDKYIAQPDTKLQWNKGYNYNINENLLYLWSSKDINFYSLDKLQLKSHIVSLTKKELSITYVFYNVHYKYTVTGLMNGHIKVWRLPQTKVISKDYILIHNFIKHGKPIDKIVQGHDQRIIISSSSEMIVCLWSLQTFDLLRQYNFLGQYTRIILLNSTYSLAEKDSMLGKLKFGKTMEFICEITSNIIFSDKYRQNPTLDKKSKVESVQFTLASNLGFQIRDEQLNSKDLNKIDVQYVYPPLKAKGIQQIIASPYAQNQYFLLVESGQIFKVRIDEGSGKIQQAYAIQRAKDVEFHQINQNPSIIKFLPIVPPQFDSQINQNTIEKKKKDERPELERYMDLKLITVGCGKGTVVFFRTDDFQFLYTRVTYHRQEITHMQAFQSNGYPFLATFCSQKHLKLVKFDEEKANCLVSVYFGTNLRQFYGFQDRLAITFQKGFFDIFQVDEYDNEYCIRNMDTSDHEDELWSLDYDTNRKLILTTAGDNKIKIWTYYKVLVYEVYLDEGLKQAVWFRDLQIILSHNLKILYFRNIGLRITEQEIEEFNSEFLMKNEERFSIKDLANMMKDAENYQHKKIQEKEYFSMQTLHETETKPRAKIEKAYRLSPKRKNIKSVKGKKKHNSTVEEEHKHYIPDTDLDAMKRHLQDIKQIRKKTNESLLPKIKPKVQDNFDAFMKSKLINKKVLTRRDITLNRIIMKNIIKEHFGNDNEVISNLKLDF